jgi:hypothetical protein
VEDRENTVTLVPVSHRQGCVWSRPRGFPQRHTDSGNLVLVFVCFELFVVDLFQVLDSGEIAPDAGHGDDAWWR